MSNYTDSSTSVENRQWRPFLPSNNVSSQEQDVDTGDMLLNHHSFSTAEDNDVFTTSQSYFPSMELDFITADLTQEFGAHGEAQRLGGINREYASSHLIGSSVGQNSAANSFGSTIRQPSYYGQPGQRQLRVTNPDPISPEPNNNHKSSGLFDPFDDESHSPQPLDPSFGEILQRPTTPVFDPLGLRRTTNTNFSPGTATSPSHSGCSPIRHSRQDSNQEHFLAFDALTAPSHSRQHSANLDLTPPRQQFHFGELNHPGFSFTSSVAAGGSQVQASKNDDPFVSNPDTESHGSNTFLARTSPLVPVSDRCHFNSVGAVDVRFANPAKARVFFAHFDKSRAYSTKDVDHVYGLDRFLGTPDAVDYDKADDFYPIERLINPDEEVEDEDAEEEDDNPGRGLKIFVESPHPSLSLPNFDNGQPNRYPNTPSFFRDYPSHFQDSDDMEWAVFNDSTYGAPRQKPLLFFHRSPTPPTYPESKTQGFVFMKYWRRNDRTKEPKVQIFAFDRDWYCQTDEILLDECRRCFITIGPTTVSFSDGNKRADVPNLPFVWTIIEQLFLCSCYPENSYPSITEIMRKYKAGKKLHRAAITPNENTVVEDLHPSDMLGWDLYHEPCDYHSFFVPPLTIALHFNAPLALALLRGHMNPTEGEYYTDTAGTRQPAFERNLTLVQFMKQWFMRYRLGPSKALEPLPPPYNAIEFPPVLEEAANAGTWTQPEEIERGQVDMETFDVQGINWRSVGVRRSDARKLRDDLYFPYTNITPYQPHGFGQTLPDKEPFFRFRRTQTKFRARLAHFQLRNLVSAIDKNCVAWVGDHRVNLTDPNTRTTREVIKLVTSKDNDLPAAIRLSTMAAGYGVVVAGGFDGEYAINGLDQPFSNQVTGLLTTDKEAISNFVELFQHRSSASPYAAFSSNDSVMRIFDVKTNTLVSTQPYSFAVNCTATSPDGRLRLIVGDEPITHIVDADSGLSLRELEGHTDHGFACAWSPCGTQIATGNQDGTIQVWDTRNWRRLAVIASDVAGYRSLSFSPPGGGQRVLLAAEPADRIAIIDAQTYATRQVHDFFGEIGGASFTPDGSNIVVANMDRKMGGMMWFERDAFAQGDRGLGFTKRLRREFEGDDVRELGSLEWFGGEKGCWERGLARKRRGVGMREWDWGL